MNDLNIKFDFLTTINNTILLLNLTPSFVKFNSEDLTKEIDKNLIKPRQNQKPAAQIKSS